MAEDDTNPENVTSTNVNFQTRRHPYDMLYANPSSVRPRYQNAREYAKALQPWLWQYHHYNMMNTFFAAMPLYAMNCQPQSGQTSPFWTQPPGAIQQTDLHSTTRSAAAQNAQTTAGHTGREYKLPPFWKRVAAELIDFTLLFYIKLIVTILVMTELGYFSGNQVSELFFDLNEIDYDKAFAISSEVIAMEIINRLLITVFETLCLRKGIGTVGGATPGKRLMGLKVVSCTDISELGNGKVFVVPAQNIGVVNALLRSVIKNLTIAFFFPACLTIFFFKHNQAMYDVLSKTIVVQTVEGDL